MVMIPGLDSIEYGYWSPLGILLLISKGRISQDTLYSLIF